MAEQKEQKDDATDRVAIAAETMHGDLMALVIDEIKVLPKSWPELSEDGQNEVIDRVRRRTGEAIGECVRMISTAGFVRLPAKLDSVQVKDGLKCVLTASQHDPARHELYDAQGETVLIVLATPEQFGGGAEAVKAEPGQGDLIVSSALKRLGDSPGSMPGDGANG